MPETKYCFVPLCKNSSRKNPEKTFIAVPRDKRQRKSWFTAVRRDIRNSSVKTSFSCCQDHFNLEEDMENWIEFRLSKVRCRMKKDVVPHKFECQRAINRTAIPKLREASIARAKKRKIDEILEYYDKKDDAPVVAADAASTIIRNDEPLFEFVKVEQKTVDFAEEIISKIEVSETMIQGIGEEKEEEEEESLTATNKHADNVVKEEFIAIIKSEP